MSAPDEGMEKAIVCHWQWEDTGEGETLLEDDYMTFIPFADGYFQPRLHTGEGSSDEDPDEAREARVIWQHGPVWVTPSVIMRYGL